MPVRGESRLDSVTPLARPQIEETTYGVFISEEKRRLGREKYTEEEKLEHKRGGRNIGFRYYGKVESCWMGKLGAKDCEIGVNLGLAGTRTHVYSATLSAVYTKS